jgi:hypothetical protein
LIGATPRRIQSSAPRAEKCGHGQRNGFTDPEYDHAGQNRGQRSSLRRQTVTKPIRERKRERSEHGSGQSTLSVESGLGRRAILFDSRVSRVQGGHATRRENPIDAFASTLRAHQSSLTGAGSAVAFVKAL